MGRNCAFARQGRLARRHVHRELFAGNEIMAAWTSVVAFRRRTVLLDLALPFVILRPRRAGWVAVGVILFGPVARSGAWLFLRGTPYLHLEMFPIVADSQIGRAHV